ncbi:MAG: class I SAM-dependent methyltransferase, partial [Cyanobacteria bacterium]|nr:class I SAM-dependent methyltransferase [Cyanobacteriota bacterium]
INKPLEKLFIKGVATFQFINIHTQESINGFRDLYFPNPKRDPLPLPDLEKRMRVFGNESEFLFRLSGYTNFKQLENLLVEKFQKKFGMFQNILDWGSGCGRITRYFNQLPPSCHLKATDIDEDNIRWCQENLKFGAFSTSPLLPPTNYSTESFDLILGLSVFTHLTEDHQFLWLEELNRISAPGAILLLTVNSMAAMINMVYLNAPFYNELQEKGFLSSGKNQALEDFIDNKDYYITAFHTHSYIRSKWSQYFEVIEIIPGFIFYQDLVILKKKITPPQKSDSKKLKPKKK